MERKDAPPPAMRVEALRAALEIGVEGGDPKWVLRDADQSLAWLTGENDGT